jgi:hypothetical protein
MSTAKIIAPIQREPELLGQTVIVIGGSAGIGFETALRARAEGANLWVLLSLFELHRFVVLRGVGLGSISGYRLGFAGLNALVLGKVILIGEALRLGEGHDKKRLINAVLLKSALFAVLLVCFDIVEEVIVGVIHGRSFLLSIPQLGGGGLAGMCLVAVLGFVTLIPFFLFTEVQRAIGKDKLYSVILEK